MILDTVKFTQSLPMEDKSSGDYPIRDIFQQFYPRYLDLHSVSDTQHRTANCISNCKTGGFGYNVSYCEECGHLKIHACACNNRNCPNCQTPLEKKWVMARNSELIKGVAYYHLIFTVPHELNDLMFQNQKLLYDLLFKCASDTILTLCKDSAYMGATPGIISVLHTWGQQLNLHPHLHTMISGGGLNRNNQFIETKHKGFIIPVATIGKMFRGKYMAALKQLNDTDKLSFKNDCEHLRNRYSWKEFIDRIYDKQWLPFIKETFNGNGNAIEYLARYAYRTAISNSRIYAIDDKNVSFRYTDYADGNQKKVKTVSGMEFLRLFLQHVLPKGFNRVRFSGFLTNSQKTKKLKLIHRLRNTIYKGNPVKELNTADLMMLLFQRDICHCSKCSGMLIHLPRGVPLTALQL